MGGTGKTSAGVIEAAGKIKLKDEWLYPVTRKSNVEKVVADAVVGLGRQQLRVEKRREVGNGRCQKMVISQNVAVLTLLDGRSKHLDWELLPRARGAMASPQFRGRSF